MQDHLGACPTGMQPPTNLLKRIFEAARSEPTDPRARMASAERVRMRDRGTPHARDWQRPGALARILGEFVPSAIWRPQVRRFEVPCPAGGGHVAHVYPGADPEIRCRACDIRRPVLQQVHVYLKHSARTALAALSSASEVTS